MPGHAVACSTNREKFHTVDKSAQGYWLKKRFEAAAPHMKILEPTDAIIARIGHFKRDYKEFTALVN